MSAQDPVNGLILSLPRVVSSALAHDIEKSSVYISEQILEMKVLDGLSRVRVIVAPGTDVETVRGKVERFLDAMLAKTRTIETKTHFARSRIGGNTLVAGVNAELVQRGWVFEHGRGQVSLAGPALRLMKLLDARFADIYRHRFGAMDCMFPAMVSTKLLNRVGYFESHPNASSFVCHLVEDFDEIEVFRKANTQGAYADPDRQLLAAPHYCLNPAACFPCYEAYQNRVLDRGSEVLSWLGRVFRYESRNMSGLDRLWEFNVRELVFLGNDDFIFQARRDAVTMVRELAEEWNLE
jgi:seryl-tRNA synthetase